MEGIPMNNLPIWLGVWSATNQVNNGAELTTFESAVIWIIILVITISALVIVVMTFKDDFIGYLKHKKEKAKLTKWQKEHPKIEEDFEDSFRDSRVMFQEAEFRRIHEISTGDTLTSIAKEYGTTVDELTRVNLIRHPRDSAVGHILIIREEDNMRYEDYELDEMTQDLINEVPDDKLREEVNDRLHRLIETEDSFNESQEAVLDAIKRIDSSYSEGDLTIDEYYGIIESVGKAEI